MGELDLGMVLVAGGCYNQIFEQLDLYIFMKSENMSTAWITGSRGFIGSALKFALIKQGYNVVAVTNSGPSQKDPMYVDFGSEKSICRAVESAGMPHILFHLGWGKVFEPQSPDHLGRNVEETKNLLDSLYKIGMDKAILVGSSSEYGSREGSLRESDVPTGRLTKYAQGKMKACDIGFETSKHYGKTFIHVRLFHAMGACGRKNSLINQLYRSYRESSPLHLTSCEQFRDYMYVDDAAEGIARIGGIDSSEMLNLGSGEVTQLRKVIEKIWDRLGASQELLKFGVRERPSCEPLQPRCWANLNKLMRMTEWKPGISLEQGIFKTISELSRKS